MAVEAAATREQIYDDPAINVDVSLKIVASPFQKPSSLSSGSAHLRASGTPPKMPVDYSKWDALELSDDSDIEVHPNVDKRSFIRAKQNQIHQEREQRKHQIATLKYERIINDGFLKRIDALLTSLKSHAAEAAEKDADQLIFQSIMESTGDPSDDQPPPRPDGVHTTEKELPTYSKMMATLVDQVKEETDKKNITGNRYEPYLSGVKKHKAKVESLQKQLLEKLAELQKAEGQKITSESIHVGFDSSSVAKADKTPLPPPSKPKKSEKVQAVEVLNPHALRQESLSQAEKDQTSSGAEADIDEPVSDEEEIEPSELGKKFAQIKMGDYRADLNFIQQNPIVLAEKETDGLLLLAFNTEIAGRGDFAKQCVHQALLLQYCRSLGRDGVGLFFKRITTKGHQAQKVFLDDVNETYNRIRSRAKEIAAEREKEEGGVEQIQLHAVDPGTTINITIPDKDSQDAGVQEARAVFEAFPPGLQRALESGSLEEVNKVLGKMSVEDAEEVVKQLGEGGMLSLEEEIIDATTEEGQAAWKEFEETEKARAEERRAAEPAGDPE